MSVAEYPITYFAHHRHSRLLLHHHLLDPSRKAEAAVPAAQPEVETFTPQWTRGWQGLLWAVGDDAALLLLMCFSLRMGPSSPDSSIVYILELECVPQ